MVSEKIIALLADQFGKEESEIELSMDIAEDLGADSLDVVELLMSIEDEFGVEIPDEEVENLHTIGDVVNYISKNSDQ